jgi:hypothetical protein
MIDKQTASKEGVYGENDPPSEDTGVPTARDEDRDNAHPEHEKMSTQEMLEQVRNNDAAAMQTGGMGRAETPKDGPTQGEWHRVETEQTKHVQKVPQNEQDSDQIPD